MSERVITVAALAEQMLELVRCAFLEGYNAGHADGGEERDAGAMAKAWVNSRAFDAVSPGEGVGHACHPDLPCDICKRPAGDRS